MPYRTRLGRLSLLSRCCRSDRHSAGAEVLGHHVGSIDPSHLAVVKSGDEWDGTWSECVYTEADEWRVHILAFLP